MRIFTWKQNYLKKQVYSRFMGSLHGIIMIVSKVFHQLILWCTLCSCGIVLIWPRVH